MKDAKSIDDIVIVIPAYNEAATIHDVASRALAICPRVIVVDDGSSDETIARLQGLPIQLIQHAVNQGKAASLWDGIMLAREIGAKTIVTLDGDGQHAPEDIPKLLSRLKTHPGQIIIGARLADKSAIPAKRYYANRIANFWLAWAAGYPLSDSQSGFRLYPAHLFDGLKISTAKHSSFVFESEILIRAAQRGIYSTAVAIPAIYAEQARPSHFRGVRDITLITLMVARSLLARGLYLPGLYRAVIKPHLLPSHDGQTDYTGYLMAVLSLLVILITGGISLLVAILNIRRNAIHAGTHADAAAIVVLGKRLLNNVPEHNYRQRLDRAHALYQERPARQIYLLGGKTGDADISESAAGKAYLLAQGVPDSAIHTEESSRNTLENIRQLRERTGFTEGDIALISNRYHLARACVMARQFDYPVEPCAAEPLPPRGVLSWVRYTMEGLLLHWFYTGLIYAKLTRNKTMLVRISR